MTPVPGSRLSATYVSTRKVLESALDVVTKDCTALADGELAEMADLLRGRDAGYEIGFLSKQREDWVLVTHAREEGKLRGFAFSTLERIGGTPSLLVGLASFVRTLACDVTQGR